MSTSHTTGRRTARRLGLAALATATLTGVLATPAFAARSQGYSSMSACRSAQIATGASSFVAITKPCYAYFPQIADGVWSLDPLYRFEYRTRY